MSGGLIGLDGQKIEWAWWGPAPEQAPSIVLLHEGLGSVALWRSFPADLAAATGCGVFAYSRPGYGRSGSVRLPRPLDYMQREAHSLLGRVLDAAGILRAILLGHSDGATIAAIYAATAPDTRVRALALLAPHFFVEERTLEAIAAIGRDYEAGPLRDRLRRYHDDVEVAFHGWHDAWLDPAFRRFEISGLLPSIRVPMLIVQGEADPYGTVAQVRAAEAAAGGQVRALLLPGIGHAPQNEAREMTTAAVAALVREVLA